MAKVTSLPPQPPLPHVPAPASLDPKPHGCSHEVYVLKISTFYQAAIDTSHSRHTETHDLDPFSLSGQVKVPLLCLKCLILTLVFI